MDPAPEVTLACVAALLGREPRGFEEVMIQGAAGEPVVIRVASLVDNRPFPTLFWLVDSVMCYRIDRLEAAGVIARLQRRIDADEDLKSGMREDHRAHIALRREYMSPPVRRRLPQLGYEDVLADRGIGGIADFTRVRCLHTWYAAHLVVPNTVGRMLDEWGEMQSS